MSIALTTMVVPVTDAAAAKQWYESLLGVGPYVDEPYYVGFRVDGIEVGLDPNGARNGLTGPVGYWDVEDIEAAVRRLEAAGATVELAITDVGGGLRIARLR